jgi:hypothetical protein
MNNDIATKIKSSLENYEAPYDAAAWDKLSQRLDAKSTSGGTSFMSSPKTWIIASITIIGATLGIYSLSKNSTTPIHVSQKQQSTTTTQTENKPVNLITQSDDSQQKTSIKSDKTAKTVTPIETKNSVTSENKPTATETTNSSSKQVFVTRGTERNLKNLIFPKTNRSYCIGEKLEVFNTNSSDIILSNSTGKQIKIEGQESMLITLKQEGQYWWNGDKIAFEVKEKPYVNFNLPSDIIYENGIPTITLSSDLNVKSQKWIFDQKVVSTNETVKISIFNKERYSVSLAVIGSNGCENQLTKTFLPDPDFHYNLKAPNGFEPTSNNSKRNTFLPLSLLERDTPFKMLIIDPKDGKVIFETNDKNNPWDGRNQYTDQLVQEGSEYIWKVILMNPEKNEKNEYRGMITRK